MSGGKCNQPTWEQIVDDVNSDCCVNFDMESFLETEEIGSTSDDYASTESCGEGNKCEHICVVRDGAEFCKCNSGYKLDSDGLNCLQEPAEIRRKDCEPGLIRNEDGECDDFDECEEEKDSCSKYEECSNTFGSYVCNIIDVCPRGYEFSEDSRKCEGEF